MKALLLLMMPLFLTSCALLQLPARLINSVIAPLTENEPPVPLSPDSGLALRVSTPAERGAGGDQSADAEPNKGR